MDQAAQTWMSVREAAGRFRVTKETMLKWAQRGLSPLRTDTLEPLILWDTLEATLCRRPRPRGARVQAASRRRQIAPRRFGRRRAAPTLTPPPKAAAALTRVLERVLSRLLVHPRLLQIGGALLGCLLIALTLRGQEQRALTSAPLPAPVASSQSQPLAPSAADQAVVNVVAAYIQASITAAVLNRADAMAPYLAPDGRAWANVQAEYQRRAARGETHDPALRRWGILRVAVDADTAMVETQEQWDDLTSVGGQVVSSQRGILTQNSYELRRSPSAGSWLITNITTTTVMS